MITVSHLLDRIERFSARTGYSETTISKWLFNDGRTIRRLREGSASVRVVSLFRADERLKQREAMSQTRRGFRQGDAA